MLGSWKSPDRKLNVGDSAADVALEEPGSEKRKPRKLDSGTKIPTGTLHIGIVEGTDLSIKDPHRGTSDPFCKLFLLGRQGEVFGTEKSKCIKRTLNPKWNQHFCMPAGAATTHLLIEVWDKDRLSKDDFMGQIKVNLERDINLDSAAVVREYPLSARPDRPGDEVQGTITIEFRFEQAPRSATVAGTPGNPRGRAMTDVTGKGVTEDSTDAAMDNGQMEHPSSIMSGHLRSAAGKTNQPLKSGTLSFCIHSGEGLVAMDYSGYSDPYCKIFFLNSMGEVLMSTKTSIQWKTLNPQWNELFDFPITPTNTHLLVEVWDKDKVGSDDFMGQFAIDLRSTLEDGVKVWHEYKLEKRPDRPKDRVSGRILLSMMYICNPSANEDGPKIPDSHRPESRDQEYLSWYNLSLVDILTHPRVVDGLMQSFLKPFYVILVTVISSYIIGYFHMAGVWLVVVLVWMASLVDVMMRKTVRREVENFRIKKMNDELNPTYETATWVNNMLIVVYHTQRHYISHIFVKYCSALLNSIATPYPIKKLQFVSLDIGESAPRLSNVIIHRAKPNEIIYDFHCDYVSDFNGVIRSTLATLPTPIAVKLSDLHFSGKLRFHITLLQDRYPFVHKFRLQILEKPDIDISVKVEGLPDMFEMPTITDFFINLVREQMAEEILYPKYKEIEFVDISRLSTEDPWGDEGGAALERGIANLARGLAEHGDEARAVARAMRGLRNENKGGLKTKKAAPTKVFSLTKPVPPTAMKQNVTDPGNLRERLRRSKSDGSLSNVLEDVRAKKRAEMAKKKERESDKRKESGKERKRRIKDEVASWQSGTRPSKGKLT